jgi:hypothetical protein
MGGGRFIYEGCSISCYKCYGSFTLKGSIQGR